MALPNMAMIPSGYKPTKLYSVLPTPADIGSELIENGDFSTDTKWSKGTGFSISGGSANCDGTQTANTTLVQQGGILGATLSFTVGKTYKVNFDIVVTSSFITNIEVGGGYENDNFDTSGNYTTYITALSTNDRFTFTATPDFIGSIDNVSVLEAISDADFTVERASSATRVNEQGLIETPEFILSDELVSNGDFSDGSTDWVVGSGWSVTNGKASCDGTDTGVSGWLRQNNIIVSGKSYKVTFDVTTTDIGTVLRINDTNYGIATIKGSGSKTIYFTSRGYSIAFSQDKTASIDNISIVEIERENIPRIDYTGGGCPVLLTEPQSTNLVKDSEDFTQGSWIHNSNLGITPNTTISPDGTQNADSLVYSGSGNRLGVDIAMTINTKYALSIYYKNNGGNNQIPFSGSNTTGATTVTITDEWARYTVIFTATATATSNLRFMSGMANANLFAWGAQIEELDYATSYMPTYGEIASRATETVKGVENANTYNSTEGVLFAEVAGLSDGDDDDRFISLSDGTTDNQVSVYLNTLSGKISGLVSSNNVDAYLNSVTHNQLDFNKIALSYKGNDINLWVNGVKASTVTTQNAPIGLSVLKLIAAVGANKAFYGKTSQVQVFNTALSDFELKLLTSQDTNYNSYEAMRLALNYNIQ